MCVFFFSTNKKKKKKLLLTISTRRQIPTKKLIIFVLFAKEKRNLKINFRNQQQKQIIYIRQKQKINKKKTNYKLKQ